MQLGQGHTVAIIGGGIVGAAIARELAKFRLTVILLEKHPDLAMGATKANSGILHAGFDAPEGSLKAALNVRGNKLYREIADDLKIKLKITGSLVVAKNGEEQKELEGLLDRGRRNGVQGIEILPREQVLAREPNLAKDIRGALFASTAGIMLPFQAAVAFAVNAVENGAKILTECPVEGIGVINGRVAGVHTSKGFVAADCVINAAGVYADQISRLAGDQSFTIRPRKGEYILFDKAVSDMISTVIFPAPTKVSKGVLVSPTVHGNLFIGPNANETPGKEDQATSAQGLEELLAAARRLVPGIPLSAAITQFAGLRAAADSSDFIIAPSAHVQGLIHVAGIQSPGLTAAPAIAEMVVAIVKDSGLSLVPKPDFKPVNPPGICFAEQDRNEKSKMIADNPLHGRVICRCETVTEGDIVNAIHDCCGASTVDGVKRRTRAGMGRCQGGFCGPRVTLILARELGIPPTGVRKDTAASHLFFDKEEAESDEVAYEAK